MGSYNRSGTPAVQFFFLFLRFYGRAETILLDRTTLLEVNVAFRDYLARQQYSYVDTSCQQKLNLRSHCLKMFLKLTEVLSAPVS